MKLMMPLQSSPIAVLLLPLLLPLLVPNMYALGNVAIVGPKPDNISEADYVEFLLNFQYLVEAFYSCSTTGRDGLPPELAKGGPPPLGCQRVNNLDPLINDTMTQFAYADVGHIRAIERQVNGFPRPLLNIGRDVFAKIFNTAFDQILLPPFDPYANTLNYLLAAYIVVVSTSYGDVSITANLQKPERQQLVAGLLGSDAGQYVAVRSALYLRRDERVVPYGFTVAEATDKLSKLANKLAKGKISEGIVVPASEGAEGRVEGNVIPADQDSLYFDPTPVQLLRIVYGTGNEHVPAGFLPKGANGALAKCLTLTL